jgi:hypothetical protein
LPDDGHRVAAIDRELDGAGGDPRQPRERNAETHLAQWRDPDAHAAQHRVKHEVVEGNQEQDEQGVQRLHLRRREPLGLGHVIRLQYPGRGFLVEQRPERRHQCEHDENAQHRAHSVDLFLGVHISRAVELHEGARAAEAEQEHEREARGDDETQRPHQCE